MWFSFIQDLHVLPSGEPPGLRWAVGSLLQWFLKSHGNVGLTVTTQSVTPNTHTSMILQAFSEDVLYNHESGLLEVVDGAAERVSRTIRTALIRTKSKLLSGDQSVLTNTSPVENRYTVRVGNSLLEKVCFWGGFRCRFVEIFIFFSAWTDSRECDGSQERGCPFSFRATASSNTSKTT